MGTGRLYYAAELVRLLREHAGEHFHIEVAAYPEIHPDAPSPDADLRFFAEKCAAGADSALTQYFYNADAYFDFCDRVSALGVTTPIIPGIMPITNSTGLRPSPAPAAGNPPLARPTPGQLRRGVSTTSWPLASTW